MSSGPLKLLAGAGAGDDPVYVDDLFATNLWDGNNSTNQITNGIDLSGEGGMVWIKLRSGFSSYHVIMDTERGADNGVYTNTASAQASQGTEFGSFNSNGYTLGGESNGYMNSTHNSPTYCGWTFRKQEKFFDIVTYTGDGTSSHTINHNLGSVPGMIIVKRTDASANWNVWHRSSPVGGNGKYNDLMLNHDNAAGNSDFWPTTPTSTQFFLGDSDSALNASGGTYVAYLFGHNEAEFGEDSDEVIIKCGSFTASNPAFVENIGFEPQWLLIKKISGSGSWQIIDNMRGSFIDTNGDHNSRSLIADNDGTENSESYSFGVANTGIGAEIADGATYVYVAIRRSHKPATEFAATDLYTTASARSTSAGAPPWWYSGFPVDMAFWKNWGGVGSHQLLDRLRGPEALFLNNGDAEEDRAAAKFDYQDGHYNNDGTQASYHSSMFRRAKGFFDTVCYSGNGTAGRGVAHNLGAVPELVITKKRDNTRSWYIYSANQGNNKYTSLDDGVEFFSSSLPWNDTTPTASVFTLGGHELNNGSSDHYVAHLFATAEGISKVGNYTGTGNNVSVDCGFSAGARFILIHRTDASGGWYLFNSNAGIVSGNDPYVLLDTTDAEVSNTDYVDSESAGFRVNSSAPAGLNASGGNYIFLAIA
jgi:hypothetical protein